MYGESAIKKEAAFRRDAPMRYHSPKVNHVKVGLVADQRDYAAAMAVRALVWLSEPGAKFATQFDENDYNSSHVLLWVDDEPVGTLRIRWFSEFARFERMAIRQDYRSFRIFRRLVGFAMDLCAAKGFKTVIGVARPPGDKFWKRFGGESLGDPIIYNGMVTVPMLYRIKSDPHPAIARGPESVGDPVFEAAILIAEEKLV